MRPGKFRHSTILCKTLSLPRASNSMALAKASKSLLMPSEREPGHDCQVQCADQSPGERHQDNLPLASPSSWLDRTSAVTRSQILMM